MLSKEKIYNEASNRFEDFNHFNTFKLGATWASEQYAGVVKVFEEMIDITTNVSHIPRDVWEKGLEELNKLKQP